MKKKIMTFVSLLSIAVFATTMLNIGTAEALNVTWKQYSSQRYLRANTSRQVYTYNGTDTATSWERILVSSTSTNPRLYKNNYTKQCLDSNASGNVYTNVCNKANKYQQWTIVNITGTDYYQQRNVATGLCLTTADPLSASAAKTATCSKTKQSQYWY